MHTQLIVAFSIYLALLIVVGFFASKKSKAGDFALGGRSTNYWVTAIALQASDTSHWLFLAFPGAIYSRGIVEALVPFGLVLAMFLNWHFIAPRLRRITAHYKSLTLFSFFEKQFDDTSGMIRVISAIIALIFFSFFIASGFVASGRLFETSFGLSYQTGVISGLIAAVFYILIGGYHSVVWCNFFQGMFLLFVLMFVPTYAYFVVGGWSEIANAAATRHLALFSIPTFQDVWEAFLVALGWGLGYFGQPHLLNFFMGIKDPKNIKWAKYLGGTWQTLALVFSFFLGLVSIAYFSQGIANPETAFIVITMQLFYPLVAGFMLCALLAATLTTLNSQILAASSILAQDLYKKIIQQHATPKTMLWMSRIAVVIVSFLSGYVAFKTTLSIYDLVAYAWSGIGAAFAPLVIASLYSKKINKHGALAGIITGAVISGLWPLFDGFLFPLIPGFFASSLAMYLVSFVTSWPPAHKHSTKT